MPLYGVSVVVLSERLKREFLLPMQVWYANDFSATASRRSARPLMKQLGEIGLSRGVFLEPAKSQYVFPAQVTEAAAKLATTGTTLKHKAVSRTLGGHLDTQKPATPGS